MAWEEYKPRRTPAAGLSVTISPLGRMSFNQAASTALRAKADRVSLLWNADIRCIGVKPATQVADSYKLPDPELPVAISCTTFLSHIGYDWSTKRSFSVNWDVKLKMFVFQIPPEFLGAPPRRRPRKP